MSLSNTQPNREESKMARVKLETKNGNGQTANPEEDQVDSWLKTGDWIVSKEEKAAIPAAKDQKGGK